MTRSASSPDAPALLIVATVARTVRGFLLPYGRHFRSLGWRVDAAAQGAPADPVIVDAFDHVHDLPLSRSLRDPRPLLHGIASIRDVLQSGGYDIVHVHTPIASFLTRAAASRLPAARRPAVAYTAHGFHFWHGGRPLTNLAFSTAERIAGRWTDRLVVMNQEDEAAARRHRLVAPGRLVRMPGIGLDTGWFAPDRVSPDDVAGARRSLGVDPGRPMFVLVAELTARKRQEDAIDALAAMRHRDAVLVLAGDGPRLAAQEAHAELRGVTGRVRFVGQVLDVRPLVRGANALLLTSSREGLARSVMEALALEVPVLASTARGNGELVGTDAGFVVPTGASEAFAERMDWLIDHPAEAAEMGRRGRERMVSTYDVRHLLRLHERLYGGLLAERPGREGSAER